MKTYFIRYYFDGYGIAKVEAESEKKAEEKFFDGDFKDEEEWGEDYNISSIEEF